MSVPRTHLEVEPKAADDREEEVSRRELSSAAPPVCSSASSEKRQQCNYTTQSSSSSFISPFSGLNSPNPFPVAQPTCVAESSLHCEPLLLATVVCPCQPPPVYIQADYHFPGIEVVCEIDAFLSELLVYS